MQGPTGIRGIGSPGAGVSNCDLLNVGAKIQTLIPWKSSICSLNHCTLSSVLELIIFEEGVTRQKTTNCLFYYCCGHLGHSLPHRKQSKNLWKLFQGRAMFLRWIYASSVCDPKVTGLNLPNFISFKIT